jgi:D-aminopeptidase
VQANHGIRGQLTIAGVPVGREIGGGFRKFAGADPHDLAGASAGEVGSILIFVATDAPLLPQQLKRLARRASLGLARTGSISGNGSGDLFLAFSTANQAAAAREAATGGERSFVPSAVQALTNDAMTPLFEATVEATEEAIINALAAGETMKGRDDHVIEALPTARVQEVLKKFNRLAPVADPPAKKTAP